MWRFPGGIRAERTMTLPDRTMTSANLITPAGGWFIGGGRAYPQNAEGRATSEGLYNRQLVPLLRARREAGFKAASLGSRHRERRGGGSRSREASAASTSRWRSTRRRDWCAACRSPAAGSSPRSARYVIALDDYRDVSGLRLPFSERALFNGAPDPLLTRTLDAIAINVPLDPALFQPAAGGGQ